MQFPMLLTLCSVRLDFISLKNHRNIKYLEEKKQFKGNQMKLRSCVYKYTLRFALALSLVILKMVNIHRTQIDLCNRTYLLISTPF